VVFLEYNVDNPPDSRISRWWAGYGEGGFVSLPLTMVDSGRDVSNGFFSIDSNYNIYKGMVDTSLARSPKAELEATWKRSGNRVIFSVKVENLSGRTLSTSNDASVTGIVYEQSQIQYTGRFVRAVATASISSLANGATQTFDLQTSDLGAADWDKLHYIALVDYQPNGTSGAYDMLQAAIAKPASRVEPDQLLFLIDVGDTSVPPQYAEVFGSPTLSWSAIPAAGWISVDPTSGLPAEKPQISITRGLLSNGWQQSQVNFSAGDGSLSDSITVKAYLGVVKRVFLPVIER
jgi:hypothetical protein